MARIAVIAGPDAGHAFPAVALGLALRRRGCDVAFVSGEQWGNDAARDGLDFIPIGPTPQQPEDADFGWVLWERPKQLAPGIAESLRSWGAELAVVDTITVPGWFAADLAGVPRVELVPHGLQVPSRYLPPPGSGLARGRTPLGLLRDSVMRRQHMRSYSVGMEACRASRVFLGLPPEGPPVATLVATIPALEPPRRDWPANTYVVGPMEWDPSSATLPEPEGEGPLVFLADSSATGRPQTLLAAAAEQLRGMRVACTTFGAVDVPDGFVAGPGRQAPLLGRSSVVVCAGGHGMVAKALVRGVPLVVVPGPGDQRENAMRVQRLGAGLCVPLERLGEAVRRVLSDPSFAAAARRAGESARGLGAGHAAERVLAVCAATC